MGAWVSPVGSGAECTPRAWPCSSALPHPELELLCGSAGQAEDGFLPRQVESCQHLYLMMEFVSNGKAVLKGQESAASCLRADKGVLFTPENWSPSPWQESPGAGFGGAGSFTLSEGRTGLPEEGRPAPGSRALARVGVSAKGEEGRSQKEGPLCPDMHVSSPGLCVSSPWNMPSLQTLIARGHCLCAVPTALALGSNPPPPACTVS